MLETANDLLTFFSKSNEFIACIEYTASKTGFRSELIEKDFLCSLLLLDLYHTPNTPLVFKGGTSLAKVHTSFYRMSEDLDFSLAISPQASRKQRSNLVKPFKEIVNSIPDRLNIFKVEKPLSGTNQSRQYNAALTYPSHLSPATGIILIEIAIREEHQQDFLIANANTLLEDFLTEKPYVRPFQIKSFSKFEAYAEKMRAALARNQPAIRDFYDMHYAHQFEIIDFHDPTYIELVRSKLSVPENYSVDLSQNKMNQLQTQVSTELLPTLRANEQTGFNLEDVFFMLKEFVISKLGS